MVKKRGNGFQDPWCAKSPGSGAYFWVLISMHGWVCGLGRSSSGRPGAPQRECMPRVWAEREM